MHRFWDSITRPLLEILQPQLLMEIGVSTGNQTIHLLEFAKLHGAVVHAVDPEVLFPQQDFETRFPAQFRFHQTTSIEAISALPRCDVYLIDGDHNYYTVFNELQKIGAITKGYSHPIVLLHDTGWPYGRRDQYCCPERIPAEARQPYSVSGVRLGQSDLDENGIHPWFAHAIKEGGEKNGVLTAVEQYITESPFDLSSNNIQGLHGYSIVYPRILETQNPELYQFLASFKISQRIADVITAIEQDRLMVFGSMQKKLQKIQGNSHQMNQPTKEMLHSALNARDQAIAELAHLRNTRSWRMTAPLRILEHVLHVQPKHLLQIIVKDFGMIWKAVGSPFPVPIRYIRHQILGSLISSQHSIAPFFTSSHPEKSHHNERIFKTHSNSLYRLFLKMHRFFLHFGIAKRRILYFDEHLPHVNNDGASVRLFALLTLLATMKTKVTFIPYDLQDDTQARESLEKKDITVLTSEKIDTIEAYLKIKGSEYDTIILSRMSGASFYIESIKKYAPQATIIFDTVDLHFLRLQRQADIEKNVIMDEESSIWKAKEIEMMKKSTCTLLISKEEQMLVQELAPDVQTFMVSNIQGCIIPPLLSKQRTTLLFVGNFYHQPNIDALQHLALNIMPIIRNRIPDIQLEVVGDFAPNTIEHFATDYIKIFGHQVDLQPFFNRARVFVAPLRFGAGVKIKLHTSAAFGVPFVTSTIGAEGIHLSQGKNAMIEDDPLAFAKAVIRLYQDDVLWLKIAENSQKTLGEYFSDSVAKKTFLTIFQFLTKAK